MIRRAASPPNGDSVQNLKIVLLCALLASCAAQSKKPPVPREREWTPVNHYQPYETQKADQ